MDLAHLILLGIIGVIGWIGWSKLQDLSSKCKKLEEQVGQIEAAQSKQAQTIRDGFGDIKKQLEAASVRVNATVRVAEDAQLQLEKTKSIAQNAEQKLLNAVDPNRRKENGASEEIKSKSVGMNQSTSGGENQRGNGSDTGASRQETAFMSTFGAGSGKK